MPEIIEYVKKAREASKKRNFTQTFDLIINLQNIDITKPENRIDDFLVLPEGRGKEASITIFSDSVKEMKDCKVLKGSQIETLGKNKRELRKLIRTTDFFFADPKLMPVVGRYLGQFLGPTGKMPKPLVGDIKKVIAHKNAVKIILKKAPIIQTIVGTEDMPDEKIAKNVQAVLSFVLKKLPRGKFNIKSILLKLTMGKPVKVEKW